MKGETIMKKSIKYLLLAFSVAAVTVSCSKWTEPEQAVPIDKSGNSNGGDYYANLRAYRASDHSVMFGYYQGWGGATADFKTSLMGLPDSVDMISLWGAGFRYTDMQKRDLKKAQELKGLKCLMVFIAHSIGTGITPQWVINASPSTPATVRNRFTGKVGTYTNWVEARNEFWGLDANDGRGNSPEANERAVRAAEAYADSLCYLINNVLEVDGFDWDFEYGYDVGDSYPTLIGDKSNITPQAAHDRVLAFVKRMRERLGDNKILMIDGNPDRLPAPEACVYFDYFAQQAYGKPTGSEGNSETVMDNRTNRMVTAFQNYLDPEFVCNRTIMLETFENHFTYDGKNYYGSNSWRMRDGTTYEGEKTGFSSFEGMARWNPQIGGKIYRKGGIGAYQLQQDYTPRLKPNQSYPQVREAIQIMNPAVK